MVSHMKDKVGVVVVTSCQSEPPLTVLDLKIEGKKRK